MIIKLQDKETKGWDYTFDWQAGKTFLPAGTPSGVVTSFVIHGMFEAYQLIKSEEVS